MYPSSSSSLPSSSSLLFSSPLLLLPLPLLPPYPPFLFFSLLTLPPFLFFLLIPPSFSSPSSPYPPSSFPPQPPLPLLFLLDPPSLSCACTCRYCDPLQGRCSLCRNNLYSLTDSPLPYYTCKVCSVHVNKEVHESCYTPLTVTIEIIFLFF